MKFVILIEAFYHLKEISSNSYFVEDFSEEALTFVNYLAHSFKIIT